MSAEWKKHFAKPGSLYRGAPFWAWNNKLNADQLKRQIDGFKEMGLGGFHMHPRTGLDTEYLSDEFMAMIQACCRHAEQEGMLAWLYDEDRWPSGAAGGLVTRDERYRERHLLFTPTPFHTQQGSKTAGRNSKADDRLQEDGILLAAYEIERTNGCLSAYRRLPDGATPAADAQTWYAYLKMATPSSWFNNQTYVDTLNPEAIKRFIEVTHERYREKIGAFFGNTVPAIFTDEPQFIHKSCLPQPDTLMNLVMPWTGDLVDTFKAEYGEDILDHLPELFWELPKRTASVWRYRYHDHVCERFTQAFSDLIGNWCEKHGIALTGHMMEEPTLQSQTAKLGESMRGYRSFQIPGIDILCDWKDGEYSTAKQAQSAAHQYGRRGILSELYGVTNWDFDFAGHKRQGDWQAALGVVHRVHHLSMVSMAGEAKRDYPASISYQSPWYKEYPVVEDHFARLNTVLMSGKPDVRVGVIHPIESYWLSWGPLEQTGDDRQERDDNFANLIQWLLYGFIDFDFISEALLPTQANQPRHAGFAVGEMEYDVILVPGLRTIRRTSLERLKAFAKTGGRVIFAGEIPSLVDAEACDDAANFAGGVECLPLARTRILSSLEPFRQLALINRKGVQVRDCLYQLRREGKDRTLFICNTLKDCAQYDLTLRIHGEWQVDRLDTATGAVEELAATYQNGKTLLECDLEAHDSILLQLVPGKRETGASLVRHHFQMLDRLRGPVRVSLSEPNALLLDAAEYKIGDGEWQARRHLLELDPIIRSELNMPAVTGSMAQPWVDTEPLEHAGFVTLRFAIDCRINIAGASLAIENVENTRILVDGREVEAHISGYFTDEAIQTLALPNLEAGQHRLELVIDYRRKTYIEWCYLLGDFGVQVRGAQAVLIEPVRELAFGDWTSQGLPFYAGNVTYHCELPVAAEAAQVRIPHFAGPLLTVNHRGVRQRIAFAPYRASLGKVGPGDAVDITVFGNRVNAFGQVHNTNAKPGDHYWYGPAAWRTRNENWADEYQLRPMGLLAAPIMEQ